MHKPQITDIWEEDTSWKTYVRFSKNLSFAVAFLMSLTLALAGPAAFVVGAVVGIVVFLLMLLSKALCDGWSHCYRYLYDLDS